MTKLLKLKINLILVVRMEKAVVWFNIIRIYHNNLLKIMSLVKNR